MYSTEFRRVLVVLPFFLALLHNHCYSFHTTTSSYEGSNSGYAIKPQNLPNKTENLQTLRAQSCPRKVDFDTFLSVANPNSLRAPLK